MSCKLRKFCQSPDVARPKPCEDSIKYVTHAGDDECVGDMAMGQNPKPPVVVWVGERASLLKANIGCSLEYQDVGHGIMGLELEAPGVFFFVIAFSRSRTDRLPIHQFPSAVMDQPNQRL